MPSCVDECHEIVCNYNNQHISNSTVTTTTPSDKIRDDWWASHLNHLSEDDVSNIDLYFTCLVDEVDVMSSNNDDDDSDFSSSHVESFHDNDVGNDFKVFTNPLYGEDFNVDQHITC